VTRRVLLWGPVIAYMVLIFVESSMSNAPLPSNVSDKWAHTAAYALMGVLAVRAVHGGLPARVTSRAALIAMLITIGYGAFDELHQWFVPGRSADPFDLLADASGGVIGLIGCWAWGILWPRAMGENADA
jgi:VanZ family protein